MTSDETKFEQYLRTLRFDDQPDSQHRDRLETRLLDAYENRNEDAVYVEPVAIYLKRLALAAGILIACGVFFWTVDTVWISRDSTLARHPDPKAVEKILQQENPTEAEKPHLLAQIDEVWKLIRRQDTEALVSILQTEETAYAIRRWTAKWLGELGNRETLKELETTIESMQLSDSNEPLVIAAQTIRQRVEPSEPNIP
jgi:hypothetical protein